MHFLSRPLSQSDAGNEGYLRSNARAATESLLTTVSNFHYGVKMRTSFVTKEDARQAVWDALEEKSIARFPFPPHGRIPNFDGAQQAAYRLFETNLLADAELIKVNPDAPQRHVRIEALRRERTVYVPTPRLRGGFKMLDPETIPDDKVSSAASLSHMDDWADSIPLDELPQLDAVVAGSVAVTSDGRRCGKGEGYSDLEYANSATVRSRSQRPSTRCK